MKSQPTDKEIIARVLSGDLRSYSILVDRYQHMVYTLAVRMLRNHELAEETAQDVFIKAYKGLGGFHGNAKYSTWLYKIAYYRILDVSDKESRRRKKEYGFPHPLREIEGGNDTWDAMMKEERGKLVRQMLDSLEEEDRAVLSLFYLQDLSLKEVGEILGLKPGTVKVRVFRARERLKELLTGTDVGTLIYNYGS